MPDAPSPVAHHDGIARPVTQPVGHFGSQHRVEHIVERNAFGEGKAVFAVRSGSARNSRDQCRGRDSRDANRPATEGSSTRFRGIGRAPGRSSRRCCWSRCRSGRPNRAAGGSAPLRAPTIRSVPEMVLAKLALASVLTRSTPRRRATLTPIAKTTRPAVALRLATLLSARVAIGKSALRRRAVDFGHGDASPESRIPAGRRG